MKWEMVKLGGGISHVRNGASIKQETGRSGIPITRIESILEGALDYSKLGYADIIGDNYSEHYLKNGDILMSHINSWSHLGKCALVENLDRKIIHGMNLLVLRSDPNLVSSIFAKHYFSSSNFKTQLHKISNQSVKSVRLRCN